MVEILPPDGFRHVDFLWDDSHAAKLDPVGLLVYRSNLLGADRRITNTGGGNTSAKVRATDPLTGQPVDVLWVKGSGGDLRTAKRTNFASLYQERLLALRDVYAREPERGVKSAAEDRMVGLYPHCTFDLNPCAPSIDTPLHSFVPHAHVDHMHPDAVIAIAAADNGEEVTRAIWGDAVAWLPWQRPGFDLGLRLMQLWAERPDLQGVVLGGHGLICGAGDAKSCYQLTLSLIERAARFVEERAAAKPAFGGPRVAPLDAARRRALWGELLPWLRGRVSGDKRVVGTVHDDDAMLRFVSSNDAARLAALGTSCPDHFLRTRIQPLFADWDPARETVDVLKERLDAGLARYQHDYAAYYESCRRPDSPAIRGVAPTVVLVPGLGMAAWGKTKSESRVTAEFFVCAVEVMRGAEAVGRYTALPRQEAFDIEYWLLEEAKLRRQPPERELARRVAVVVGAGNGIGHAAALRLAEDGAAVVCADLDLAAAERTAAELTRRHGVGIGVAGTGVSGCGPAIACRVDVTDPASVAALFDEAVLAYGGVDHVVVTAGVYPAPDRQGRNTEADWRLAFDINVTGAWRVADAAARIWRAQSLPGSLVLTTSVNAAVAKRGSLPYDASKAAANHLVRELAIELAPWVRVNAVAPATVVAGSTMFGRERVIASLTKYGIAFDETASDDALRDLLADFYAQRTLTRAPVRPADQAEAIAFLVGERSSRTTGQVLTVDGGLHEAFLR
ncbi:MAG: bifunctional rhamnulose-1-phosphate aldolase/short-chain dehydrogenase [Planctomycetes bacterium]|nr:bifunctional rhamnulose-1-phosphate aldolase/short-chain dehydrogenase [Planctomycetota bacterium]